tara:strand:+ start:99 stop:482 length:384 start_codon:yes stop_codon:yes gene_type:complete
MMANKNKYTKEQLQQAIQNSGGFVSVASNNLNCTRKTIYNYLEKYPELKEMLQDIKEQYLDMAEAKLIEKIRSGATPELLFYLKTQGKSRGYVEKQQIDLSSNDEQINKIEIEIVKSKGNDSPRKES